MVVEWEVVKWDGFSGLGCRVGYWRAMTVAVFLLSASSIRFREVAPGFPGGGSASTAV